MFKLDSKIKNIKSKKIRKIKDMIIIRKITFFIIFFTVFIGGKK